MPTKFFTSGSRFARLGRVALAALAFLVCLTDVVTAQPQATLSKTGAGLRMLRSARRLGLSPARSGRRAQRMIQDDGLLRVTLKFHEELTAEQIAQYEQQGVSFARIKGQGVSHHRRFYPAQITDAALIALNTDPSVAFIDGAGVLNAVPTLDVSLPEIQADLRHRTPAGTAFGNQGQGMIIADFEVGGTIDVFHPDFFKPDEFRPYEWIDADGNGIFVPGTDHVDLNRNGLAEAGERLQLQDIGGLTSLYDADLDWLYNDANNNGQRDFGRSAGFNEADPTYGELIFLTKDTNKNRRLDVGEQLVALGQSKIRAVRDFDGTVYERGVNLIDAPTDNNGHGTSVCSILIGQDAGYNRRHVGVAPDAELILVHSQDHLANALWAKAQGADVMLWEFGSWVATYLDGSSGLEQFIADEMAAESTLQVTPTGNLASSERHARFQLAAQATSVQTFRIPANLQPGQIHMSILWTGPVDDLTFELRRVGAAQYTQIEDFIDPANPYFDGDHLALRSRSQSDRGTSKFDIQLGRTGGSMAAGDWNLRITNSGQPKTVHLMIQDNATTWNGGVTWTANTTDENTLCYPATNDLSLRVCSYSVDSEPGALSYFSSRGPRMDGINLEGVTAPGHHDIYCAQTSGVTGLWADYRPDFGGTSAAGPHAAGAAALLMSAVGDASVGQVFDALTLGARQDGFTGPVPNNAWAHGKLRVDDAYRLLADTVCPNIGPVGMLAPDEGAFDLDPLDVLLSWQDDPNAQVYDVYLSTSNPPAFKLPNVTLTSLSPGSLEPNTTYYWQVYAKNFCGYTQAGPVRFFTTGGFSDPEINVLVDGQPLDDGDEYTFADTLAGERIEVTFTIENNGPEALELLGDPSPVNVFNGTGEFFVEADPPQIVGPFGAVEFTVAFAPDQAGSFDATLDIPNDDADENPYTIRLFGTAPALAEIDVTYSGIDTNGQPFDVDIPHESAFAFPDTELGRTTDLIFHIFSRGDADLELLGPVLISGPDAGNFAVSLQPGTNVVPPPDAIEAFRVAFTPSEAGTREATVTIPNNDPDESSYTFTITGFGVDPEAVVPPIVEDPEPDPGIEDPDPIDETPDPEVGVDPIDADKDANDKEVDLDPQADRENNGNGVGQAGGGGGSSPCGAGGLAWLPILFVGLCGLRPGRMRPSSRSLR